MATVLAIYTCNDSDRLPRNGVIEAFKPYVIEEKKDRCSIKYPSGEICEVSLEDDNGNSIASISILRPPREMELYNSLAAILRLGKTYLSFSGGGAACVASADAAQILPAYERENGPPVIVRSGADIEQAVLRRTG